MNTAISKRWFNRFAILLLTTLLGFAVAQKMVVIGVTAEEQGIGHLIREFEAENPGITVEYNFFPSERFPELFTAVRNAGEQVDVLIMNGQDLRRYAKSGDLQELTGIEFLDRFRPVGLETYTIDDQLWALPWGNYAGFPILYNAALLEAHGLDVPATYEELVEVGNALRSQGVHAFTHPGQNIYLWPVWFFTTYAQTSGNNSIDWTVETLQGQRQWTDPEVVQALDAIFRMSRDDLFMPGILSNNADAAVANLFLGQAAFLLHHTAVFALARDQEPEDFEIGVTLFPNIVDGAQSQFPGGTGAAVGVHSRITPERRELALSFIEFITRDQNVSYLAQQNAWPATTNLNAEASEEPIAQYYAENIAQHLEIYLDWLWPPEVTRAFQEGIQAGVAGRRTAEQVAQDIQTVFDRLVADGYRFAD